MNTIATTARPVRFGWTDRFGVHAGSVELPAGTEVYVTRMRSGTAEAHPVANVGVSQIVPLSALMVP